MKPQLPIDVNEETGVWTTDSLPMLYVPRHFFTNNHIAVEEALGREKYAQILYDAGYKSAWYWCEKEAKQHDIGGLAVFEHYLNRLSQRGWGLFSFVEVNTATARAKISLKNSSFVLQQPETRGRLCYMFSGWFAGAMDWVSQEAGSDLRSVCSETHCCGEHEAHVHGAHCTFTVQPLTSIS